MLQAFSVFAIHDTIDGECLLSDNKLAHGYQKSHVMKLYISWHQSSDS